MTEPDPAGSVATAEAQERDDRYQQLVELAPDGILIHDGERVVLANTAAVRLAGGTEREQVVGQPIESFLDPPYLKAIESQLTSSGDLAAMVTPVRDTFHRIDGSTVQVDVTALAFLSHGRVSAHLIVRDVTGQIELQQTARHAELRLQQAQKMDTVGALAGGVAHEVNNMMSVILGLSELLLEEPDMPASRLPDVHQIMEAAARAATVTRQLLSFSRRAFHQPRVVELGAAVRELRPLIGQLMGEGRTLHVTTEGTPRVWADPGQLEQVIVNLALNARDAMPAGGMLSIRTMEVAVPELAVASDGTAVSPGPYGALVMQDSGVGMDLATQAKVFEPFFTTKAPGKGTGLGLAAVYGIMKQNGGFVGMASAPGTGTTFTLYLPLFTGPSPVDRRRAGSPPRRHAAPVGSTVLVVDDEPHVLAVAARSLERSGFRVLRASEGRAALELVERDGPPDVVLTDLMMPGMGGAELARRLKERWPDLPIVFMSGYSVEDLLREGVSTTDGTLLEKPFTPDRLVASVGAALLATSQQPDS